MKPLAPLQDYFASRLRLLLLGLALMMLYAGVGFQFLPQLAQIRWLPQAARQMGLKISTERIDFNPFTLSLSLQGLAVHDPAGHPLLAAGQLRIRLGGLDSLRHWRPALEIVGAAPVLHLQRDRQGRFSLGGWRPDSAGDSVASVPMILNGLVIDHGRLEFLDAARGTPVTTVFQDLSAEIGQLGDNPSSFTPLRVSAQGPKAERLSLAGEVALKPLAFKGVLEVERLDLPFWTHLLKPDLDWSTKVGRLTTRLTLQWPIDAPPGVELQTGHLVVEGLDAAHRRATSQAFRAQRIELGDLYLGPATPFLRIGTASLSKLQTPWGQVALVSTEGLAADWATRHLTLTKLNVQELASAPGKFEAISMGSLTYDAERQTIKLANLAIPALHSPWGQLKGLDLTGGEYGLQDRRAHLDTLVVAEISTRWGDVTGARLTGLDYLPQDQSVSLTSGTAQQIKSPWGTYTAPTAHHSVYRIAERQLAIDNAALEHAVTPWGGATRLAISALTGEVGTPALRLGSLAGAEVQLSWGNLATIAGEALTWNGPDHHLAVGKGAITGLVTPHASVDRLEAETLSLDLASQRFAAQSATLMAATALGPIDNEATPPTPDGAAPPTASDSTASAFTPTAPPDASGNAPRRAQLGNLHVEEVRGDWDQRNLAARQVDSDNLVMDLVRLKNRDFEIRGLPVISTRPSASATMAPWQVAIDELRVHDYSINVRDETTDPPARLRFNGLKMTSFDVNNARGNTMVFKLLTQIGSSSRLVMEGRMQFQPFRTSFRFGLDKLRMRSIEPYWKPLTNIDLQRGNLSLWGDVIARLEPDLHVDYAGGAEILDIDAVDRPKRQPVMKWNLLKFDGLAISNKPRRFVTRVLTAEQPYARIVRDEHNQLNLLAALEPPNQAAIPPSLEALQVETTPANQLPTASVGLLRIKDGVVDFTDKTMQPGFVTQIRQFDGTVSGLSSRVDAMARLSLNGRINRNSPVRVFGELDPMDYRNHTDVTLQFQGLNLTTFSAYSGKFGGYRIEKGKLNMDLRYTLQNDQMEATNRIVLDQLTLGERVDESSPWLVDLAIMILKNGDGKIDIDLPIHGSLTNPEFSVWTLYRDAFASLFAKLFYSPASLVNGMIGGQLRQDTLHFAAGQTEVDTGAGAILKAIAATMTANPTATIDIQPAADPRQDRLALAAVALLEKLKVDRRVELRAQGVRLHGAPVPELTDEDYRRLFTAYYREKHPTAPELRTLEPRQPLLSGRGFEQARSKVLDEWPVDETEVSSLAQMRGESVRGYLIDELGITDQRIFLRALTLENYPKDAIETRLTVESL